MKTTEIKKVTQNSALELMNGINDAFEIVEELKANTDWQLSGTAEYNEDEVLKKLADETLNQRKKLKRRINSFLARKSMRSANLFFNAAKSYIGGHLRFDYSEKEKKIKAARKKYVEARNIAIQLYKEYKEEKGDYYKNK